MFQVKVNLPRLNFAIAQRTIYTYTPTEAIIFSVIDGVVKVISGARKLLKNLDEEDETVDKMLKKGSLLQATSI